MTEQIYNASAEARERGERLRRIRNLANLSRKMLCDDAQININTYIGYEVGRYGGLTKKGANVIIPYLSSKGVYCSLDWLMDGHGRGPHVADEPISGALDDEQKVQKELMIFHAHYRNAIHCQIKDDGMFPTYEVNDHVAGVIEPAIEKLIGFHCIVKNYNGDVLIRNVREGRAKGTYTLTCINPNTLVHEPIQYDVKLECAAKIIWHRKPYELEK